MRKNKFQIIYRPGGGSAALSSVVITKDVPEHGVVGVIPARIIKQNIC